MLMQQEVQSQVGCHRLDALLKPRSAAIVGASPRPGSFGNDVVKVLRNGGYRGAIYPINPKYDEIDGLACYPSIAALPGGPDLAVLAVAGERIEAAMAEAITGGARAVTIFDNCYLETDTAPKLLDRLKLKAAAAGIPVCGGNGMGFYNFAAATHVSFQHPPDRPAGGICLIAHSGSVFVLLAANDPRYRFNLVISAGQEINATVADYIDFALEQPDTRVIALFIETIRDPLGFVAAVRKAGERGVPVVVVKVGRTEESARLAATHCGAIAGNDAAHDAVFDRYGVLRVDNLDELMATALVLSHARHMGPGGLAAVTDSGGLRELLIDLADRQGVPFARIAPETRARLRARLPYGLDATNPLDAAGPLRPDYPEVFKDCLDILVQDQDTAMAAFEFEVRDDFVYMPAFLEAAEAMPGRSAKPFLVLNSFSGSQNGRTAVRLLEAGVPLINGVQTMLTAVKVAFAYRDWRARPAIDPPPRPEPDVVHRWHSRLADGRPLDEAGSLKLLAEFGLPVVSAHHAEGLEDALQAADAVGYPVALKTARPGVHHKSDVDGVRLNLTGPESLRSAYGDIAERLGPTVIVEPMVPTGVELAFGMTIDPQFGPIVMVASGGRWIEVERDRICALPPFDAAEARRLIDRLKIRPLLSGTRGMPAADVEALAQMLARFSVLVDALAGSVAELDVNPVLAGPAGAVAVDALVIARA